MPIKSCGPLRLAQQLKVSGTCRTHCIHEEDAVEKYVSCLAACLRDQQEAVARGAVQHPVIVRCHGVMICAYWIAGAQAFAFKRGLQNLVKAMGDFDEAAQGSLVSCAGGVDQDAVLDRLSGQPRKQVDAFFQGAGRIGDRQQLDMGDFVQLVHCRDLSRK